MVSTFINNNLLKGIVVLLIFQCLVLISFAADWHEFKFLQNNLNTEYGNDSYTVDSLGIQIIYFNCRWDSLKNATGAVRLAHNNHPNGAGYIEVTFTKGLGQIYLSEYHGGNRKTGIFLKSGGNYGVFLKNDIRGIANKYGMNKYGELTVKFQYTGGFDDRTPHIGIVHFTNFIQAQKGNIYVSKDGNDSNSGSLISPFASIGKAIGSLSAGDTCFILEGRYNEEVSVEGLKGSSGNPIVFMPWKNQKVILDGTIEIKSEWEQHRGNIYKTYVSEDVWQLWVDSIPMTLARYPNSIVWSDHFWDQTQSWALTSGTNGLVQDFGLAQFDVSLEGCVMVINNYNWRSRARKVTSHQPGSASFTYDVVEDYSKSEKKPYFLTGFPVLDSEQEWFYNAENDTLYLWAQSVQSVNESIIRAKNKTWFFNSGSGAEYVDIRDFTFFGTTINMANSANVSIQNCDFLYPNCSQRTLGVTSDALHTNFVACDSLLVYNCSFQYSDGKSLTCTDAVNPVLENNLFYQIDYACLAAGPNSYTIQFDKNLSPVSRRNTIHTAGASEGLRIAGNVGEGAVIEYNFHTRCGLMQTDGASIQFPPGNGPVDCVIRYNWFINNRRMGMRWDGDPAGSHGNIYRCVAALGGHKGFRLKGDQHEIYHLVGMDATGGDDINISKNKGPGPNGESNMNSMLHNCAAENIDFTDNFVEPANKTNNWDAVRDPEFNLRDLLRDPDNLDFRPAPESKLIDAGKVIPDISLINGTLIDINSSYFGDAPDIGAYEFGDSVYWIPGRKYPKATNPIPLNGAQSNDKYLDLMWRQGLNAKSYDVYFGTSENEVSIATKTSAEFKGNQTNNIYNPEIQEDGRNYFWRVDAIETGKVNKGDTWMFITKDRITGVDNIHSENNIDKLINIYPNPVHESLNLKANDNFSWRLVTFSGTLLKKGISSGYEKIDVRNLSPGSYVVEVIINGLSKKEIIIKLN